jgi:CRISPR/Cas system-associated protein Cas10 (large subunit of type III CRISPR-Cas system)
MSDIWSAEYKANILDELQTANDANEYLNDKLTAVTARAERDALRAAVEAVPEWVTLESPRPFGSQYHGCPWCKRSVNEGHAPDCQRQQALGEGEKENDG